MNSGPERSGAWEGYENLSHWAVADNSRGSRGAYCVWQGLTGRRGLITWATLFPHSSTSPGRYLAAACLASRKQCPDVMVPQMNMPPLASDYASPSLVQTPTHFSHIP